MSNSLDSRERTFAKAANDAADSLLLSRLIVVVSAFFVGAAAWLSAITENPTVFSPHPAAASIPIWLGVPRSSVAFSASVLFLIVYQNNLLGSPSLRISRIINLASGFVAFITFFLLFSYWNYGCFYQGKPYMAAMIGMNLAMILIIFFLYLRMRNMHDGIASSLHGGAFFVWLFWCAIPFIGERV